MDHEAARALVVACMAFLGILGLLYLVVVTINGTFGGPIESPASPDGSSPPTGPRPGDQVCRQCGTVGTPQGMTGGTILVGFVLSMFGLLPGLAYFMVAGMEFPRGPACSAVKSMIPQHTPEGRRIVAANQVTE